MEIVIKANQPPIGSKAKYPRIFGGQVPHKNANNRKKVFFILK